jgi:formamidopyrimidine-DNA glycosylase
MTRMPELPEVEEVRRGLDPWVRDVRILRVEVRRADFVTPDRKALQRLAQRHFVRTHRHGKKLFCIADDGQTLMVHLGMSGHVEVVPAGTPMLKHTHVVLTLESGREVRFRDPRRFGGVWWYRDFAAAQQAELAALGPDALVVTVQDLALWRGASGKLKARLLSQKDVAGLGNIYVDEALWLSELHPLQRVGRIRPEQLARLVACIHEVLGRSIAAGGTTIRDYRNVADEVGRFGRQLQAYGRAGKACRRCGTALQSAQIATRTTVYCPKCQKRR